ncbi:MAG TPA: hypothetical protein P5079_08375, partial [Elusimicrobiota bacterium]|nr:hypothetical protein [Elusimicrobiota bacterium]
MGSDRNSAFSEKTRSVLVVRLSSLGDIILAAPVFENIKAAFPSARLSVLVKKNYAEVLRGMPAVD